MIDSITMNILFFSGPLLQVFQEKSRTNRGRLPSLTSSKKEEVRQTYLFTNHLLLTTRAKENGRLHLAKVGINVRLKPNFNLTQLHLSVVIFFSSPLIHLVLRIENHLSR